MLESVGVLFINVAVGPTENYHSITCAGRAQFILYLVPCIGPEWVILGDVPFLSLLFDFMLLIILPGIKEC